LWQGIFNATFLNVQDKSTIGKKLHFYSFFTSKWHITAKTTNNKSLVKCENILNMLEYTEYTKMLIGLIAILNPLGAVPIFISLTSELDVSERRTISNVVVNSVLIILLLSLFIGNWILIFFGITISSFRVAGGLLILLMAISMMHAKTSDVKHTAEEAEEGEKKDSIAVVPIATPLLAGPGAISTVILYASKGMGLLHYFIVGLVILATSLLLYIVFKLVPYISKYMSQTSINVFTRIMGLILAAISIEFMARGFKELFPALM